MSNLLVTIAMACFWTLLSATSTALATDRFYPDIAEHSPSKEFLVEAKSPDNAAGEYRPFQTDFVYTFTNVETGEVVWTHKQKGSKRPKSLVPAGKKSRTGLEGSPASIEVSDDGWTVVRTAYDSLIAFNPEGEITLWVAILGEAMAEKEVKKFVSMTTAGPMWSGLSHWYFAAIENQKAYVIRPWWGLHGKRCLFK